MAGLGVRPMTGMVTCGRVWGQVAGGGVYGRDQASGMDGDMWQGVGVYGRGQASGMDGDMWQGVGSYGRGWGHVTRDRGGVWDHVAGVGACHKG